MKLPKPESSGHYSEKSKKSQQYGYFLKLVPRAKSALGTRLLLSMVPSVSLLTGFDFNMHIHDSYSLPHRCLAPGSHS